MHTAVSNSKYRAGVGIILINNAKKIFVGQRKDTPDAWQMPQGGIDEGEDPLTAAFRELKEEIGTNQVKVLAEATNWLKYDLPPELIPQFWEGKYIGQQQKWFLMKLDGADSLININTFHPEFSAWKWADLNALPNMIVPFKKKLYEELVAIFQPIIETL